jgi:hypothetical protein
MKLVKKEDYVNYYSDGVQPDGYVEALETIMYKLDARNKVLELNAVTVNELNKQLQETLEALKHRYRYR